ncbi:response regulator transcription factor [Algivirga pacifica]|uniref:Response regulator transcription factor n=1 Tax=Algivirga pacifica TaxID=1162670 RepID=A0ABP9DBF7_9BACT
MNKIKLLLVDDHVIVRHGIKMLLDQESNIDVLDEASDGEEALEKYKLLQPDVVVMDIRMPKMNGIEATEHLIKQDPQAKVLILSMHEDEEYILEAVRKGALGYVLKDAGNEEFLKAINTVYAGSKYFSGAVSEVLVNQFLRQQGSPAPQKAKGTEETEEVDFALTKRETEILRYVVDGMSSKDIALKLSKSIRTIEAHRFNIMKKLEVKSALELVKKVNAHASLKKLVD